MVELSLISEFILVRCIFVIDFLVQWLIFLVECMVMRNMWENKTTKSLIQKSFEVPPSLPPPPLPSPPLIKEKH
jgi:hypothetical protein